MPGVWDCDWGYGDGCDGWTDRVSQDWGGVDYEDRHSTFTA